MRYAALVSATNIYLCIVSLLLYAIYQDPVLLLIGLAMFAVAALRLLKLERQGGRGHAG